MRTRSAFQVSLLAVLTDEGALLPAVIGGLLYSFFYPLPYLPQGVQHIPVIVADYDSSPLSRRYAHNLDATREVAVVGVTRDVAAAAPLLQRGEIGGIVAIPPRFAQDVARGTPTGVTVMGNGAYLVVDGTTLETAEQVLASTAAPPLAAHLVQTGAPPALVRRAASAGPLLIKQPMFNTTQGYQSYVVPASMSLIVHQLLIIGIATVLGTWIERRRWPVAPEGKLTIGAFTGMLGAFTLLAWCATLFWIGFVFWFHDLPRGGNLGAAAMVGALYSVAIAAVAVCLGCLMADRERPFQLIGALSVPLLFLSGFAFPTEESIPRPLHWLSEALPTTHGIRAMLKLNQMGASWHETATDIGRLLLVTCAYVGLAWWLAIRRTRATETGHRQLTPLADSEAVA